MCTHCTNVHYTSTLQTNASFCLSDFLLHMGVAKAHADGSRHVRVPVCACVCPQQQGRLQKVSQRTASSSHIAFTSEKHPRSTCCARVYVHTHRYKLSEKESIEEMLGPKATGRDAVLERKAARRCVCETHTCTHYAHTRARARARACTHLCWNAKQPGGVYLTHTDMHTYTHIYTHSS